VQACFECGEPATSRHHVVPKSRGGTKTVPLCSRCHDMAHGIDHRTLSAEKSIANVGLVETVRQLGSTGLTAPEIARQINMPLGCVVGLLD